MAFRIIQACKSLSTPILSRQLWNTELPNNFIKNTGILSTTSGCYNINDNARFTSFFCRLPAAKLWKGATHVSNAGRKRGRGKSRRLPKNLDRGQTIGIGKKNMLFPGLTSPIIKGREMLTLSKIPDDPDYNKKIYEIRDSITKRKRMKLTPLERGWSGGKPAGRKIGPPDPVNEEKFEDFDSRILEYKMVCVMTGNMGRKRRLSTMVITGNKNGLAGFALGKAPDGRAALKQAKNRAAQKLIYIPRYKEHTVLHDFVAQFGETRVYVFKKHEGYGLVCHRAIKTCCEVIGIKDIYAKIEGSTNLQKIVKAFFIGLLQQKSHQQLAEEKGLHLVELKKENDNFPVVVASPAVVRKPEEISSSEIMDFRQYVIDGKIILKKKKLEPFYTKKYSWVVRLRKTAYLRNKEDVRIRMLAEHGELRSFYTDKYPECKPAKWDVSMKKREDD